MSTEPGEAGAPATPESRVEGVRGHGGNKTYAFTFDTEAVKEIVDDHLDVDELPEGMTKEEFIEGVCRLMEANIAEHFYGEVRYFCLDGLEQAIDIIQNPEEYREECNDCIIPYGCSMCDECDGTPKGTL